MANIQIITAPRPKPKPSTSLLNSNSNLSSSKSRESRFIDSAWESKHAKSGPKVGGDSNALFLSLRSFFIFGKYIGLIPWKGLHQKDASRLVLDKGRTQVSVTLATIAFSVICTAVAILDFLRSNPRNAAEFARAPGPILYFGLALFNAVFFFRSSTQFIEIMQEWSDTEMKLYYTKVDKHLKLHVVVIASAIMTSAILENITGELKLLLPLFLPLKYGGRANIENASSPLEVYYRGYHKPWAHTVPYHPLTSVLLWIHNKLSVYAWNFRDLTIIIFARAIYGRFKILYEGAKSDLDLLGIKGGGGSNSADPQKWSQLAKDHAVLSNMLETIVKLFSPLVFCSYAANMYFILLHVHGALTPKTGESVVATFYGKWSFLHIIGRLTCVTLMSSKIHEWAHKSKELFSKCPQAAYSTEVTEKIAWKNRAVFANEHNWVHWLGMFSNFPTANATHYWNNFLLGNRATPGI